MGQDPVSSLVGQVDVGRLRADVARLAKSARHSLDAPIRYAEAIDYISAVFHEHGLKTRQHTYSLGGRRGINIVGSLGPGTGTSGTSTPALRPLLVCAHYDTVPGSRGADDNASGVAVLLECVRNLSTAELPRRIDFAAFDMEEVQPEGVALVGSTAFAKEAGGRDAYEGVYNLEMVGYTSGPGTQSYPPGFQMIFPSVYERIQEREFRGDFIAVVALGPGIELGRTFTHAAEKWVPGLDVVAIEVARLVPALLDIFRSDHSPFWEAGVPAIMITDTANFRNPHYHSSTDTPDTLDYRFMGDVARALIATLAEQSGLVLS